MKRLKGLPPIISKNPKILILGSFPGGESLLQKKYYAHGTNSFWKLLFMVFEKAFSNIYTDRLNLLNENNIAVWDVVESCYREGGSDKKMIVPKPNDIPSFLKSHKTIHTMVITSGEVQKFLFQFFPELKSFSHIRIVSSSSGTIGISSDKKLKAWNQLRNLVK